MKWIRKNWAFCYIIYIMLNSSVFYYDPITFASTINQRQKKADCISPPLPLKLNQNFYLTW